MTNEALILRELEPGEEPSVCSLARAVFDEALAPSLGPDGVEEFHRYTDPSALVARLADNHIVLVAPAGCELAGIVEIRHRRHISMLFVSSKHRGKGLGSQLLRRALALCGSGQVTVHAEPHAVPFYSKHGFASTAPERIVNGLRFVPMTRGGSADDVAPDRMLNRSTRASRS